jgi:hypothetical protein
VTGKLMKSPRIPAPTASLYSRVSLDFSTLLKWSFCSESFSYSVGRWFQFDLEDHIYRWVIITTFFLLHSCLCLCLCRCYHIYRWKWINWRTTVCCAMKRGWMRLFSPRVASYFVTPVSEDSSFATKSVLSQEYPQVNNIWYVCSLPRLEDRHVWFFMLYLKAKTLNEAIMPEDEDDHATWCSADFIASSNFYKMKRWLSFESDFAVFRECKSLILDLWAHLSVIKSSSGFPSLFVILMIRDSTLYSSVLVILVEFVDQWFDTSSCRSSLYPVLRPSLSLWRENQKEKKEDSLHRLFMKNAWRTRWLKVGNNNKIEELSSHPIPKKDRLNWCFKKVVAIKRSTHGNH